MGSTIPFDTGCSQRFVAWKPAGPGDAIAEILSEELERMLRVLQDHLKESEKPNEDKTDTGSQAETP